ncbi:GCN5- N-acetyltransferase [Cordyceps fumosorosea ARSEF 2679]|uniref:GCN5-N-acetyltransferase n=1 Tax=Cordyceps fumosorosea (strain ARSEF 2679) TaxID=1081104 RepID=A0A162JVB6_CORFA|nr:GCN5- N-acetyltransferase [Cordyceps fumosorosea ARSEF 2679]OAA74252.1 GCN5- N-acetyltransferase [Cordyceps fumosorosea ARSEF 2679]
MSTTTTTTPAISLREITKDNWRAVIDLDTHPHQRGNVSTNARSLCEAHYSPDAWVRAIYAGDALVGFLMMSIWEPDAWASIWRFMIDARFQGRGCGAAAIRAAAAHVRAAHPEMRTLRLMSAGPGGKAARDGKAAVEEGASPYRFYCKLGFRDIEPADEFGEVEMGLDLHGPELDVGAKGEP